MVTSTDANTFGLADTIYDKIHDLTGRYPLMVYNRINRTQLDPNREEDEGTFGNANAVSMYQLYHEKIEESLDRFNGKPGLILDIHGYKSDPDTWIILGMIV